MEGTTSFHICSFSVPPLADSILPALAVATCRAGGVGIVDLDGHLRSRSQSTRKIVASLIDACGGKTFGLRFSLEHLEAVEDIAQATGLKNVPHWFVVSQWQQHASPSPLPVRKIWFEITEAFDLQRLTDYGLQPDGLLARGAECGGACGNESTFVLAQALAVQPLPFLLQGGLGLRGCVASRVAGATGAVLDDALLLLAESPVRERFGASLTRINSEDTVVLGAELGLRIRIPSRPELQAARSLQEFATQLSLADAPQTERWSTEVASHLKWDDAQGAVWPVGQAISLAKIYESRYRTTGRCIQAAIQATSTEALAAIAATKALAPESDLASSHGTRFPVVQGPMTRVSDTPGFARAVSDAGALPLVALAMFRADQAETLLEQCSKALGKAAWGAGLLAFLPAELRDQQMAAMARFRPPFALLAGGLPEQVRLLESQGTTTYLHAPTPALLQAFFAQGVRRFVFEGSECGGHAGPLHSLPLWELAVETLLKEMSADAGKDVHILFAGGIHDALSSAMVAAIAHPLVERGVRIGVLAGTAYLFTEEAVQCGAIVEQFQKQAIACDGIVQLRTGPGHVVNCANTPFRDTFEQHRKYLHREGKPAREITAQLEELMLGRSRVAAKGQDRELGGVLRNLAPKEQLQDGIYMMGQVAALRRSICTVADLHRDMSEGSVKQMERFATRVTHASVSSTDVPIAIVGAACLLPGAHTVDAFWRNVLNKVNSVREIPKERFDWRLYFDEDRDAADRIYSRWGTFLDALPFDPVRYGIPPHSLPSISAVQLLTLEACRRALEDAGFGEDGFDRENTAVVLGTDGMADLYHGYIARAMLPSLVPDADEIYARLPEWSEESFPGILSNVAAGRVANRLDLRGPNYSVDAACASSLAALQLGMRELQRGDSNVAVVAGAEFDQNPYGYLAFSKTRALSPTGQAKPFDSKADGIVIGEGVVALVLKRLEDAERDGDRVYSVIRSVAGSSDGRAMGLTAPRSEGQQLAMRRAYSRSGIDAATLGMYEAHGTGTVVGDKTELATVASILTEAGAKPGQCVIGSAKGLLGHTKAAAGLVGVLKASLALHHKTLPPHAPIESPLSQISKSSSPVRVLENAQAWTAPDDGPRRAGVSAFGFGGTNFHAVLEEHRGSLAPAADGANQWPVELFLFGADDLDGLLRQLRRLKAIAEQDRTLPLQDMAASVFPQRDSEFRLALLARDHDEIVQNLHAAEEFLLTGKASSKIFYGSGKAKGEMAFVFPGQGSQYPGMGAELGVYLPEMRSAYDSMRHFSQATHDRVKECLLPARVFGEEAIEALTKKLQATDVAQPALAVAISGMLDFVRRIGLQPAMTAGHSFGEFAALHAAGAMTREAFLSISEARGAAVAKAAANGTGAMAAIDCTRDELQSLLPQLPGVHLANHNGPRQCVIAGDNAAITKAVQTFSAQGITARRLPVGAAFHSPAMSAASPDLRDALSRTDFQSPSLMVSSNVTASAYPATPEEIRQLLSQHLESSVEFVAQVEAMYRNGARTFVEVGPKSVLSGLIARILGEREHLALSLDGVGSLRGLLTALGRLFTAGIEMRPAALFAGRAVKRIKLEDHVPPSPPRWYIDGGRVWPAAQEHGTLGALPLLTIETRESARPTAIPSYSNAENDALQAYSEYQKTMRSFLESQEQALQQFLDRIEGGAAIERVRLPHKESSAPPALPISRPAEEPKSAPQIEPPAPQLELTLAGLTAVFTQLAAERTGYEPELLLPDLDLETELGIDSIKRIEILATAESKLPAELQPDFRRAMDRLTQTRTIAGLANAVLAMQPSVAPQVAPAPDSCPHMVMRAVPAPLAKDEAEGRLSGLFLVTRDNRGIADAVCALLQEHGTDAIAIDAEALTDAHGLRRLIDTHTQKAGAVQGIVHLLPLDGEDTPASMAAWQSASRRSVEGLFHLLQASGENIAVAIALTGFGGRWGRDNTGPGLLRAVSGGVHGVLRTYAAETGAVARVVDIDSTLAPDSIARIVLDELLYGSAETNEVGYSGGERIAFVPVQQQVDKRAHTWTPDAGSVILITGGARGVTALAAADLAVPGAHLILVGHDVIDETTASGQEKLATLQKLRQAGSLPEYHAVDVCNEHAFGDFIDQLYLRFGKVDAVIHGAGRIADKLIRDKSTETFREIFATKADSTFLLCTRLRSEHLKLVVLYGSVSGRFGNLGQVDYAAGNEVLNRLAWHMSASWPQARVVCINWGPWKDSGMATSTVLRLLEARGILPISSAAGQRLLIDELSGSDVEVVAGAGPWMNAAQVEQLSQETV